MREEIENYRQALISSKKYASVERLSTCNDAPYGINHFGGETLRCITHRGSIIKGENTKFYYHFDTHGKLRDTVSINIVACIPQVIVRSKKPWYTKLASLFL